MLPQQTIDQARAVLAALEARGQTLATAESCTGGLIAAALTAIAGSSSVVMAGFVTYSNAAKMRMVGVAEASLAAHGAVSEAVAREMAEGALREAQVDVALSCTGIAGAGRGHAGQAGRAGLHRLRAARGAHGGRAPCLPRRSRRGARRDGGARAAARNAGEVRRRGV
jgi:nicotinamide-nucleotide amidase